MIGRERSRVGLSGGDNREPAKAASRPARARRVGFSVPSAERRCCHGPHPAPPNRLFFYFFLFFSAYFFPFCRPAGEGRAEADRAPAARSPSAAVRPSPFSYRLLARPSFSPRPAGRPPQRSKRTLHHHHQLPVTIIILFASLFLCSTPSPPPPPATHPHHISSGSAPSTRSHYPPSISTYKYTGTS